MISSNSSPIPKLLIFYIEQPDTQLASSSTIRICIKDQLQSLDYPFNTPLQFDLEPLAASDAVQVFLEQSTDDIVSAEFPLKEGEHQVSLIAKDNPEPTTLKFSVRMPNELMINRKILLEKSNSSDHDCPKCSSMEKIYESQQNHVLALEEQKNTLAEIKEILKEYYSVDHIPYTSKYVPEVEELGVELPSSYHGKTSQISKQEGENLKSTIVGISEKLKNLQVVWEDVKTLRQSLFESHMTRLKLQKEIRSKVENLEKDSEALVQKYTDINEERFKVAQGVLEKQYLYSLKEIELNQVENEISMLKGNLEQLRAEQLNFSTTKTHISKLDSELKESVKKRDDLVAEHDKFVEIFSQGKSKHYENIQHLKLEKTGLMVQLGIIQKEFNDFHLENEALVKVNTQQELEIAKLQQEINELDEMNKEVEQARLMTSNKEDEIISLHKNILFASVKFNTELQSLSETNSNMLKEKMNVMEELNKLDNLLEIKTVEAQDLTRNNYSSIAQCTILEQQVCIQDDQYEIQKKIDSQQEVNEKIKNILLGEISAMGERLKKQSEECVSLSREVEFYKKKLDEKNNFKKEVKRIISDLKLIKKTYVAVRGEQVDELLAEVLGDRNDWIDVGVKRVKQGFYVFGSKDVELYIDENCLMVRFGRARMDIQEFLDVYIPLEMQKFKIMKRSKN